MLKFDLDNGKLHNVSVSATGDVPQIKINGKDIDIRNDKDYDYLMSEVNSMKKDADDIDGMFNDVFGFSFGAPFFSGAYNRRIDAIKSVITKFRNRFIEDVPVEEDEEYEEERKAKDDEEDACECECDDCCEHCKNYDALDDARKKQIDKLVDEYIDSTCLFIDDFDVLKDFAAFLLLK